MAKRTNDEIRAEIAALQAEIAASKPIVSKIVVEWSESNVLSAVEGFEFKSFAQIQTIVDAASLEEAPCYFKTSISIEWANGMTHGSRLYVGKGEQNNLAQHVQEFLAALAGGELPGPMGQSKEAQAGAKEMLDVLSFA